MAIKSRKRRFASIVAAGLAAALTLSACGGGTGPTTGPTDGTSTGVSVEPLELHLLSHRYAALEFYAKALADEAPEGVTVDAELMTYADWQQKMRINLSSGSSAYDLTYIFPPDLAEFASNGWLLPLDEYIEKYRDEYNFDDIPKQLWDAYTYDGHIYGIPSHQWAMIMFSRNDLLQAKGIAVPQTMDEFVDAAKQTTDGTHFGTALTLKAADHLALTFQSILTACGGWWFDDDMKPTFNSPEAICAIDYIKSLIPYAPDGVTTYGSDEAMIAMAQDKAVLSLQQTTRSAQMNDPSQSVVVGKVNFEAPPSVTAGGPRASLFSTAGYSISKFSKADPERAFLTIANATDEETMVRGAEAGMPVRQAVLTDELLASRPDYAAAAAAIASGARMRPAIPEFNQVMEISMRELAKVLAGQAEAQPAMDQAAAEVEQLLAAAGYYG